MTPEELKARGGIYFDKIQNGMAEYDWDSQFFSPRMAQNYLRKLWEENGPENSFVDCHYPFLEKESQEKVLAVLKPEQQEYLKRMAEKDCDLLQMLDEELLSIATTLNDREMLFFSFYFTKNPCTIWGNYKQEYLIFQRKKTEAENLPKDAKKIEDQQIEEEKTKMEKSRAGEYHMRIFAHRGFSGMYPENTMLAFQKAYEVGCDGIELDVQMTKDDVLVIMHDETIDRTTNGKGNIRDYTYEELCRFDCCGNFPGMFEFQKIPTLREYLEWVKPTGLLTNIELKNSVYYYRNLEEKVIEMVREFQMEDKIIFSSFNLVSMVKCKQLIPEIPMGFLMETRMDNMGQFAKDNHIEYHHPDLTYLTKDMVEDCHSQGVGINVWTVNKKKHMKKLAKWKVDGIFTNYPNKAKKLRQEGIL